MLKGNLKKKILPVELYNLDVGSNLGRTEIFLQA